MLLIEIVMRPMFVVFLRSSASKISLIVYSCFFQLFFFVCGINFVRQIGLSIGFYTIKSFLLFIPVIIRYFMSHSSSPIPIAFNILHLFYTNHYISFNCLFHFRSIKSKCPIYSFASYICYTKYVSLNLSDWSASQFVHHRYNFHLENLLAIIKMMNKVIQFIIDDLCNNVFCGKHLITGHEKRLFVIDYITNATVLAYFQMKINWQIFALD